MGRFLDLGQLTERLLYFSGVTDRLVYLPHVER